MRTDQPVNNHDDLLAVIDRLLEDELGLKRSDTGGKVTFAGLDPLRPTVLKTGAASAAAAAVGSIATAMTGAGKVIDSRITGDAWSHSVSPVVVSFRPMTATIMPAPAEGRSSRLFACIW